MIAAERETATLWDALERIYRRIVRDDGSTEFVPQGPASMALPEEWNPVEKLRDLFGLSDFELDILLLCAGAAIDGRFGAALAIAGQESQSPTYGLAAAVLEKPHWSALSRLRPLRYWRLIEIGAGSMLQAPLAINERILQYLLGVPAADEQLELLMHPLSEGEDELPEEWSTDLHEVATRGVLHWKRPTQTRSNILLTGGRPDERETLFRVLCGEAGRHAWVMDCADLPDAAPDRERLARTFTREAALGPAALLVRTGRLDNPALLEAWLDRVDAPVAVDVESGSSAERLSGMRLAVPMMTAVQRKALWQRQLGPVSEEIGGKLDSMAEVFTLGAKDISNIADALQEETLLRSLDRHSADALDDTAWRLCREASRRSLDELATHVEERAAWKDLILPTAPAAILRQIVAHARQASTVHGRWGFAGRDTRGLGLSALFSGASGTGKTMAAGVLAQELNRDLYQIDLATVVSKYIGETEKHLRKIFDAAERSGAILLFDEADALFGKRSQVRDSHDRYANLEVSYLLQRMESYRGIAILTSNMQNALDPAFQRRLRFVIQFPFPDANSRERIWRGAFPAAAPTEALQYERLAQLNVTGGTIRNIGLLAAFLAADDGTAITMRNILEAARTEYAKLDKPLTATETRGWE